MAHSTLLSTYSGLLWLNWQIPHYGSRDRVRGSRAFFLCSITAARVSQYGGVLWRATSFKTQLKLHTTYPGYQTPTTQTAHHQSKLPDTHHPNCTPPTLAPDFTYLVILRRHLVDIACHPVDDMRHLVG